MAKSAKIVLSNMQKVALIDLKNGEKGVLLPVKENGIFVSEKGNISFSTWVRETDKLKDVTHTGTLRLKKEDAEAWKVANPDKYMPSVLFLNLAEPAEQEGVLVSASEAFAPSVDDLPF